MGHAIQHRKNPQTAARGQITSTSRFAVGEASEVVAVSAAAAVSELSAASLRAVPEVARHRCFAISRLRFQAAGAPGKDGKDKHMVR